MSESPFDKLRNEKKTSPHPFIEGRPVAMVAVWKIHAFIHPRQDKVRARWRELSDANLEPMRRQVLTGIDEALAWVLRELSKLDTVMMK